jgi:hypothetical protein
MKMAERVYNTSAWGEVKADVYDDHKPYIEMSCEGDMGSTREDDVNIDSKRWPPGTKILIETPCCPECETDAELADDNGKCECGLDWKIWAEEQYS